MAVEHLTPAQARATARVLLAVEKRRAAHLAAETDRSQRGALSPSNDGGAPAPRAGGRDA